ncbi:TetR/AcrR family transcriptional regulator [Rhodopseudomonas boonkerdii]|uniref:TetR/AcrR family transcriptional regulator n=1 Tax=Rhodopseudomonas boonkerdii TaxID=475937 RepID=UPI001E3DC7BB|nr:TetR/AcrR family transcriptional regulator [Rhodopseudomonas boonkerdii]UGV25496.1 TetR/AcrR family transcriptional regulator [Rhodopseudomonas boonkerdii]
MVQKRKPSPAAASGAGEGKRRGRPRAYEPDVAIGQALDLFRRTGYAATSLDDLSTVTGMNRPSLYGAFGDKRALYIKSYQRYRDDYTAEVIALFKADIDIRERLRRFYAAALDIYTTGDVDPRGCFAVMTVASDAIADPEIRAMMVESFKELDDAFAWCFRTAIARGELPETANVDVLAKMASALLNLSSIRARAGIPRAELDAIVDEAITQLCRA